MSACFLAADEGNIELGQMVALKNRDKLTGSGTLKMARAGSVFSVEELINRMIRDSDNTATNMLTNVIGVDYLRNVFSSFGFKNTNLSRRVADYKSRIKGIENYTTAGDMAMILERMYRRNLVNKKVSEKCLNTMSLKHVNDRISKYLPADVVVAHKTGLERSVCHDVGIVSSDKGDFLICVLTAKNKKSNSARSKRFIARVALHTYEYLYGVRS
jgi:beta-lactamase class A